MDVSEILSDLDDFGFADTSTTRKVAVLNETYWDVCGRQPWPFLQGWVRLAFTGTVDQASNMPADFYPAVTSMEHEDQGIVEWVRFDDFEARYGAAISPYVGVPKIFYFIADELHFFPWPGSDDRVRMGYIKTPAALTSSTLEADIIIPKQYHRGLLVNGAVYRLAAMEDDPATAGAFRDYYEQVFTTFSEWINRQQYQRPQIIHPVDPDDLGWELT